MDKISREHLRIEPVRGPEGTAFDALYNIYSQTIPSSEQKTRKRLEEMAGKTNYRFFTASSGGKIVGLSVFYLPVTGEFALLEYMAIGKAAQRRGFGGELFKKSVDAVQESNGKYPVLVEVDSEREITPDRSTRLRRIRFYRNLGCRRIQGLAYLMPSVVEDRPPDMDLYILLENAPNMAKSDLRRWLETIYQEVYGCSAHDPRIETMLDPLDELIPFE